MGTKIRGPVIDIKVIFALLIPLGVWNTPENFQSPIKCTFYNEREELTVF